MKKFICLLLLLVPSLTACSTKQEVNVMEVQESKENKLENFTIKEQNNDTIILSDDCASMHIYRDILINSKTEVNKDYIEKRGYTFIDNDKRPCYAYAPSNNFESIGCWIKDNENQCWSYEMIYPMNERNKYQQIFLDYTNSIDVKEELQ